MIRNIPQRRTERSYATAAAWLLVFFLLAMFWSHPGDWIALIGRMLSDLFGGW